MFMFTLIPGEACQEMMLQAAFLLAYLGHGRMTLWRNIKD